MTSDDVIKLLLQRAQEVEKKKGRVGLFLYLIPIVYFLLQFSVLKEIKVFGFNIKQIELVNLATPIVYSLTIFYFIFLNEDIKAIKKHIEVPELTKENVPYFFSRGYLIYPPDLPQEILRNMKYRNWISEAGTLFIFFPLSIAILLGPLVFLFFAIYNAGWGKTIATFYINYFSSGISLWLFSATVLYAYNRKKENKKVNFL